MALRDSCISASEVLPVAIGSGTSLSGLINLGGLRLFGIAVPAAWTAASLTFQVSPDGGTTWVELADDSAAAIAVGAAVSTCSTLDPKIFSAYQYLRIRSGTAASPVAQAADRTLQLFLRSI